MPAQRVFLLLILVSSVGAVCGWRLLDRAPAPAKFQPAPRPAVRPDTRASAELELLRADLARLAARLERLERGARAGTDESGRVTLDASTAGAVVGLEPGEVEALRELSLVHEIVLDLAEQNRARYAWKRQLRRIESSAERLARDYGLESFDRLRDEWLTLGEKKLVLDHRREQALARGVPAHQAEIEWQQGWQALHLWMEERLIRTNLCNPLNARDLAFDSLAAFLETFDEAP